MICLHHEVCNNLKVDYTKVNRVSLLFKVNQIRKEIENLKKKKYTTKEKLNTYINNTFEIPKLKQKSSIGYQDNKLDLSMERKDKEEGMLKKIIKEQCIEMLTR